MPSASFGSNQVDFGGMIAPASATSANMPTSSARVWERASLPFRFLALFGLFHRGDSPSRTRPRATDSNLRTRGGLLYFSIIL
jgi:hypothetical protein